MRQYNYGEKWKKLLTPEIVTYLSQIHEFKGKQTLFKAAKADILTKLTEIAKIQSTEASNKIEGIYTSSSRLKALVNDKTRPKSRDEMEIAGYRDVLNSIHEDYDFIPVKPNIILQLHRDLYRFEGMEYGGKYKTADNIIQEVDSKGNKSVRFKPVAALETPEAMTELCKAYEEANAKGEIDSLLLIPMFILDFLCIHPFNDGNGRMSRLLTLLLLYKSNYIVGKYVSIEHLIEKTKVNYYDSLQKSSYGWYEEENDYEPFVKYMLSVILAAYRDFADRVTLFDSADLSKPERVREVVKSHLGPVSKSEIIEVCPDISAITIQRAITEMLTAGEIEKIGGGRYTKYVWKADN